MINKVMLPPLAFLVIFLQGCATANSGSIEHGIQPYNYGTTQLERITVLYGKQEIKFQSISPSLKPPLPQGAGKFGVRMQIPEEMTVIWHTEKDASEYRVTIPLKNKVSYINRLLNWKIRFFDNKIELWREDVTGSLNPHTMLLPTETKKIFPSN